MPNPAGNNGHSKPPPNDEIRPLIEMYVNYGYKNDEIVGLLWQDHQLKVSLSLLKKRRMQWGVVEARGQRHTVQSIRPAIERVRARFPAQGSHDMRHTLLQEEHIMVPRQLILDYMNIHHRDEVLQRRSHRLIRKQFWCAGVNDIWCVDQHDKWRAFQVFLHVAIEPFSGRLMWLKAWWTNKNPRLIFSYYCEAVAELGAMPLITQSDPGTENNGIANGHTILRHRHDPSLADSLQHRFMGGHRNVKPEIKWRQVRRQWAPGFHDVLTYGLEEGIYNPDDPLERMVFHYVFIPWIQMELDLFRERFNMSKPRRDKHKVLPHGRPNDIFRHPENFESLDFGVQVDLAMLDEIRDVYAPHDHPVFLLVPKPFEELAKNFIEELALPPSDRDNIWNNYADLLGCFHAFEEEHTVQSSISERPHPIDHTTPIPKEDQIQVLDLKACRRGDQAIGLQSTNGVDGNVDDAEESDSQGSETSEDESVDFFF